jgi:polyferredoxin
MSGLSEITIHINNKNVNAKRLKIIRYSVFAIWLAFIIVGFILAGGIKGIDPLHLTNNIISVDAVNKYIIYYAVLFIFIILTLWLGKRGACHSICWMSPFLVAGYHVGRLLKIPQMRIQADSSKCISCKVCDRKCPMSICVSESIKDGYIKSSDCILCGECVEGCNKNVLSYTVKKSVCDAKSNEEA